MFREYLSLFKVSQQLQIVWARAKPQLFGLDRDILLCATYLNPQNHITSVEHVDNFFFVLGEELFEVYKQTNR